MELANLHNTLQMIYNITKQLEEELIPTTPPSGSNAGVCPTSPGPKLPMKQGPFFMLYDTIDPYLDGWGRCVANEMCEPYPSRHGVAWKALYLKGRCGVILGSSFAGDCVDELQVLAERLCVAQPNNNMTWVTIDGLAKRWGIKKRQAYNRIGDLSKQGQPLPSKLIGGKRYYNIKHPS